MSKYYHILPAIERSSSPLRKAEPSADTTVAINLRFFEDESKNQAEREYDDHYGRLPDPPDGGGDCKQRVIHKKRRKVRSAIVSRRKSALYEKKLEEELEFRDRVNERLKKKIAEMRDELHSIQGRIDRMEGEKHELKTPSSRQAVNGDAPRTASPSRTTSLPSAPPLPSVQCITRRTSTLPVSKQSLRLPSIHEPKESSQVTLSVGPSP